MQTAFNYVFYVVKNGFCLFQAKVFETNTQPVFRYVKHRSNFLPECVNDATILWNCITVYAFHTCNFDV